MPLDNFTLPLEAVFSLNANAHSYGLCRNHNAWCLFTANGFFFLQIQIEMVTIINSKLLSTLNLEPRT